MDECVKQYAKQFQETAQVTESTNFHRKEFSLIPFDIFKQKISNEHFSKSENERLR